MFTYARMRQLQGACQLHNGDFVNSPDQMLGLFIGELTRNFQPWLNRLKDDPQSLCKLEREVSASCTRGAGMIVVGLMVGSPPAMHQKKLKPIPQNPKNQSNHRGKHCAEQHRAPVNFDLTHENVHR